MSAIKDLIMNIEEEFEMDYASIPELKLFKYQTENTMITPATDHKLIQFFHDVVPDHANMNYYGMVTQGKNYANLPYYSLNDLCAYASTYSSMDYNVYFSPAVYSGWRNDVNVRYVKSLFVDIDDIEDDTLNMTTSELTEWLISRYALPVSLLPNWAVCSGHGIHLYYIIDELDLSDPDNLLLRKKYIDNLIYYFDSDIACRNLSRVMRVPLSYNIKNEKVPTRLHHLNQDTYYSIQRLDFFLTDSAAIDAYYQEANASRNVKRKETMRKNGTTAGRKKKNNAVSPSTHKKNLPVNVEKPKTSYNNTSSCHQEPDFPMEYRYDYYTHARSWNIIVDLHNYYVRRKGNITGYRHTFCFILSAYYKLCEPDMDKALSAILPYFEASFQEEAKTTVESVYQSKNKIRFTNRLIAIYLDFMDDDYNQSYCNYSQEDALACRKKNLKRSRQKQLLNAKSRPTKKQEEKSFQLAYVEANMGTRTNMELASDLGISCSTIKRLKQQIKANIKN